MTATESRKRKVLMVYFSFPPVNNPGALRVSKFANYLPEFGWEPVVLTANTFAGLHETLPPEIDEAKVVRTPFFDLWHPLGPQKGSSPGDSSSKYQTPDRSQHLREAILKTLRLMWPIHINNLPLIGKLLLDPMGWYPYAVKKGEEILATGDIDIILSTYTPVPPHLVASHLHRKTGIPWIAEFRDLWALHPSLYKKVQPFQFLAGQWEKRIIKNCELLLTVSEPLAEKLAEFHSKKVTVIPNGFDEEDYRENVPLTSKFTITYTGLLYDPALDPTPLFEALAELRCRGMISPEDIEVRFCGKFINNIPSRLAKEYCLEDVVKTYDFIPFKDNIRRQKESTVLSVLGGTGAEQKGMYTTKLFEYLGAGRPILAIAVKGGMIDKLLQESGAGIVAERADEIKEILVKWIDEFRRFRNVSSYYNPNSEVIKRYSRKEETKKLARVLDEVVNSPRRNIN
jgi:glycosyltransferase involved in cell wall biosynthesis